jgi:hypothetical protein
MARWKGTIGPAAGRDTNELALFCADVELSIDGGPPIARRVRNECLLVDDGERRRQVDVSRADIVGWPKQIHRGDWSEIAERVGDLYADVAPEPSTPVKLTIRQPGRHTSVVVDGEQTGARIFARRVALESNAPKIQVDRRGAGGGGGASVSNAAVAAAARRSAGARAHLPSPSPTFEPRAGVEDRGGVFVPLAWAGVAASFGFGAWRCLLLTSHNLLHPSLALAGRSVAAALVVMGLLALSRAFSLPNEGAPRPGLGLVPEFVAGAKLRDTFVADVLAVVGFLLWSLVAGGVTLRAIGQVVRSGDVEQRESMRGGRQGGRIVDVARGYGGTTLLLAGAIGVTLWFSRRRNAHTANELLGAGGGVGVPSAGSWVSFDGTISADRPIVARWTSKSGLPGAGEGDMPASAGEADEFVLESPRGRVIVPAGATWSSTFAEGDATFGGEVRRWIPTGAHAVVAGFVELANDDEILLRPGGAGEHDDLVVFATSPQQEPRALLRTRLLAHQATALLTFATIVAGLWMMISR